VLGREGPPTLTPFTGLPDGFYDDSNPERMARGREGCALRLIAAVQIRRRFPRPSARAPRRLKGSALRWLSARRLALAGCHEGRLTRASCLSERLSVSLHKSVGCRNAKTQIYMHNWKIGKTITAKVLESDWPSNVARRIRGTECSKC
jgi:hypothetical protein